MVAKSYRKTGSCTVFVTGGSMAVTLPKEFTVRHRLRKKDPLPYIMTDNAIRFIPLDDSHPIMSGRKENR